MENLSLIEVYKNHNIYNWDNVIAVNKVEDGEDHLFIVALDDSKMNGKRKFLDLANTTEEAKKYIDWLTK
jgi:hypothetical protein